jgi:hypothetical protein
MARMSQLEKRHANRSQYRKAEPVAQFGAAMTHEQYVAPRPR